jgi:hypothetical protein
MAARQAPQLRLFRNDFSGRGASLAIHLAGTASNRDAVGARVVVETERLRRTKIVQAGSGFLSQHSKELLFGLGPSQRVLKLTVQWPSGHTQVFTDVKPNTRLTLVEGATIEAQAFAPPSASAVASVKPSPAVPSSSKGRLPAGREASWLYEPFPAPDFSLADLNGTMRSLAALGGHPAVVLLWSSEVGGSRAAVETLARGARALVNAGIGVLAIALDAPANVSRLREVSPAGVPIIAATPEVALSYAILNRHVFMNRQDLQLPTAFLLDRAGGVVKAYRDHVDLALITEDAATIDAPADIAFNIPGIDARNLTGTDGNPNARVVLTCDPGSGSSSDPYRQINTACFAPPQPGSDGAESARFFLHAPPINNIDLSLSKRIRIRGDIGAEVRLDMFNFLNHTQFTGVNNTVNFKSLSDPTIENLPYDASGNLVNQNGFGTINGVAPPRQLQLVMRFTF